MSPSSVPAARRMSMASFTEGVQSPAARRSPITCASRWPAQLPKSTNTTAHHAAHHHVARGTPAIEALYHTDLVDDDHGAGIRARVPRRVLVPPAPRGVPLRCALRGRVRSARHPLPAAPPHLPLLALRRGHLPPGAVE